MIDLSKQAQTLRNIPKQEAKEEAEIEAVIDRLINIAAFALRQDPASEFAIEALKTAEVLAWAIGYDDPERNTFAQFVSTLDLKPPKPN